VRLCNERGRKAAQEKHSADLSPYAANLCLLSGWVEFADFREDFGEPIRESVEAVLRSAVRQGTTEHLDGMLSKQQRIDYTVQTAAQGARLPRPELLRPAGAVSASHCSSRLGRRYWTRHFLSSGLSFERIGFASWAVVSCKNWRELPSTITIFK
jgi:hypothetical protein